MLVRMLEREREVPEEVMDTNHSLLNLPEERALQLVAEGICVVVSPQADSGGPAGLVRRSTLRPNR